MVKTARSEALAHLGYATNHDADRVLQELVDDARDIFGADLCIVHLVIPEGMYFRAWSGPLPGELAESKIIPEEMSMCPPVVEEASPLVVQDLAAEDGYRDHFACAVGGMRFYAGAPLITSGGTPVGTLCLMDRAPKEFTAAQLTTLGAFARAVMGRLELLGSLERERAARKEEARRANELLRTLDSALDIITTIGFDGIIRTMNRACVPVVGYEPDELVGRAYLDLVHPDDLDRAREAAKKLSSGSPVAGFQGRYRRKDGGEAWIEWNATPLLEEGAFYCVARDITSRKHYEEDLRAAESKYRSIFENAVEGIFQSTPDWKLVTVNPMMARIYGYASPEEMLETFTADMAELYVDPLGHEEISAKLARDGVVSEFEVEMYRKDGAKIWVSTNARAVFDDAGMIGHEGTVEDITARRNLEEKLEHRAFHDGLTNLPNRALFMDRLRQALARSDRREGESVAVLFMDLDGFKVVNDSLGHEKGDELLVVAARRLEGCVRLGDTVARLGGDEFTVLLEDVTGVAEAVMIAERAAVALAEPFELAGEEVLVSASIGIALSNSPADSPEDLMRDADLAMYRAKETGKARYEVFAPELGAMATRRLGMAGELRRALERGELRIHYQPIVSLADAEHRIVAMEALLRWEHPERGLLSPDEFIPLAEETGLILPIGRQTLMMACHQAGEWRELLPDGAAPQLCVNLSAKQLRSPDLRESVLDALDGSGLRPRDLCLEVSGDDLVRAISSDARGTLGKLRSLEETGVCLVVDDLGAGRYSLSLPSRLPAGYFKIDRAVVAGLGQDGISEAVALAVTGLAGASGAAVVAEGVETEDQLALLTGMGCGFAQGYLFSPPIPHPEATKLLPCGG